MNEQNIRLECVRTIASRNFDLPADKIIEEAAILEEYIEKGKQP